MTDFEKVVKALECRKAAHRRCGNPCEETGCCPYAYCVTDGNRAYLPYCCNTERICDDALTLIREQQELLKEAEPVKSHIKQSCSGLTWWYVCGACNTAINPNDKFCHECGRAVKWE